MSVDFATLAAILSAVGGVLTSIIGAAFVVGRYTTSVQVELMSMRGSIDLLKQRADAQAEEIRLLRQRSHDLANEMAKFPLAQLLAHPQHPGEQQR